MRLHLICYTRSVSVLVPPLYLSLFKSHEFSLSLSLLTAPPPPPLFPSLSPSLSIKPRPTKQYERLSYLRRKDSGISLSRLDLDGFFFVMKYKKNK